MSTISGVSSASSLSANYLNLLVTQMKNQDPLNPMDNAQMTTQLTQLSQLEQMETANTTFAKVLTNQQVGEAAGLVGKSITYTPTNGTAQTGVVKGVDLSNGDVRLQVGSDLVEMANVNAISN